MLRSAFYQMILSVSRSKSRGRRRPQPRRRPRFVKLYLERFEDRITPTGPTLTDLASFNGTNGANPLGGLIMDSSGNLYGTTQQGGANGDGTVFKLAKGSGTITTLASFSGSGNGAAPQDALIMDRQGNLYGTTWQGGANNDGVVFELDKGSNTITTLATFNGTNGANPRAGVIRDGSGNLYGTTVYGGANGVGTVFELTKGSSAITTLATFNNTNGAYPYGDLLMDGSGNLYGATNAGGTDGIGTLFELAKGSNTITTLASCTGGASVDYPDGGLIMDSNGNLFGASNGGSGTYGVVFELAKGSSTITTLATFDGVNGGGINNGPVCGLLADYNGNLYGTNQAGGTNNGGVVFELAKGSSTITDLASFDGTDGQQVVDIGSLIADGSGNIYGTTYKGGANGDGVAFELSGAGFVGQPDQWTGAGSDSNWSDGANWSTGAPPTIAQTAVFTNNSSVHNFTSTVDSGFTNAIGGIDIDSSWGGTINVDNALTVNGNFTLASGTFGGSGAVNVTGTANQWTGGTINLGTGGFTNTGTLSVNTTGGNLVLSGAGTFINQGTLNGAGGNALDLENGATLNNNTGAKLNWAGGTIDAIDGGLTSAPGTTTAIGGSLLGSTQNAASFNPQGTVLLNGSGTSSSPQQLEVMSQNLGAVAAGYVNNFAYGTLQLGTTSYVQLVNQSTNSSGSGPETLYVDNLIVPAGATLDLNGLPVYARAMQINGTILNGTVEQLPPGGGIVLDAPVPGIISSAYPSNDWTFFGRAGQAVSVVVNPGDPRTVPAPLSPTLGSALVEIADGSGNILASATSTTAGAVLNLLGVNLPADGIYHIVVTGLNGATGNYTLAAYNATVNNYSLSLDQNTTGKLYNPYQVDHWSFTALANDQVQFNLLNEANSGIQFDLTGPNGYAAFSNAAASSGLITLPSNDTYVLTVHSTGGQAGAYAFNLAKTTQTALTLGTTYQGTLQGSGQAELFTVNVPQGGQPLMVNLVDSSSADQNQLYVSYGSAPTTGSYQYRYSNLASNDQRILVPSAAAGTWYVLLYGNYVPAPSRYSLTAVQSSVILSSITPDQDGTSQDTYMTLTGAGFNSTTQVKLIAAGGTTTYAAASVQFISPTQISATFTANAVPAGTYSVEAVNGDGSTGTLPDAFTMVQGGEAHLVTNLIVPNPIGRHIASTLYVSYSNTGDAAMPAPLLVLTAFNPAGQQGALMTLNPALQVSGFWTSAVPQGYSSTIQILASGATPGLLQPGESITVPVYYAGWLTSQWDFNDPHLTFQLGVLNTDNTSPIDWSAMESSLQPAGMSSSSWAAIYPNLTTQLGPTWGGFVQRLDQDASYLAGLGENVTDVGQLWSFEVQQANAGICPVLNLSSATDMSVQAPGLPLSIGRSFGSTIENRNQVGPFGYGWALGGGWGQTLAVQSDGTVVVTDSDGSERIFQPDTQSPGSYFAQPGDYGTLAQLADGDYTLTEQNGLVTDFSGGQVAYIQDTDGNRITAGYSNGLLSSLTNSFGQWIHLAYNSANLIATLTNSEGQTTTYTYGAGNQYLLSVTQYESATDTVGYTTSYTYSGSTNPTLAHALASVTNPDGTQQLFSYDSEGRLSGISAAGRTEPLTFSYGVGAGAVSDADGESTTYYFDDQGLLAKISDPLGRATLYSYDGNGNLVQATNPAGQVYSYQYNTQGNLIQSTDPLGDTTKFTYGPLATFTSVTDPNGNTTRYQYDQNGDLTAIIYADGTVEQNAFNPIGEILQSTDGDGNVVNYAYNAAGLLTSETFANGTQTTYSYDQYANLTSATDSTGTTTLTYDSSNRLTEVLFPNGTFLRYSYDNASRRAQMVDQTGYTVNYQYNALGQLAGLTDGSGNAIVSYSYDAAGRLSEEIKGNGTYTVYTYDAAGEVLSVINYAPGGAVNSSFVYTYNNLGLTSTMTTVDGQWVYTYDATGQLTQALFTPNSTDPDGLTSQNLQYVYDAAGNRTETITNGVVTTYVSNVRNEYTSTTTAGATTSYQYDPDGNLISQTAPSGTTTYKYNLNNQLADIQAPGGVATSYQYDVFGNLYTQTQNGQQLLDLSDPFSWNVVGQYMGGAGGSSTHYNYGVGLVRQVNTGGLTAYYDFDNQGSTADLTDSSGNRLNTYTYLPFGGSLTASGTVANPFQYVGGFGVMATAGGLDFMHNRYYVVATGQFAADDPLNVLGGDVNVRRYADNSPVNWIDPEGTDWRDDFITWVAKLTGVEEYYQVDQNSNQAQIDASNGNMAAAKAHLQKAQQYLEVGQYASTAGAALHRPPIFFSAS